VSRKICVVTGSRAEYGLLRWVMEAIRAAPDLRLQLIVTGMHLSPEFGLTYREIERDGFHIDRQVEMLLSSDTAVGIAKSMGLGLIGFGEALQQLQPDVLLVLGDRFEIFSAAAAALVAKIPIAHLHGGETTEGAFDEALRHSITKMAQLHFVAAEEYRRRVVQLGENPERVFLVGGLGIDSIKKLPLLDRAALETELGWSRFIRRRSMMWLASSSSRNCSRRWINGRTRTLYSRCPTPIPTDVHCRPRSSSMPPLAPMPMRMCRWARLATCPVSARWTPWSATPRAA